MKKLIFAVFAYLVGVASGIYYYNNFNEPQEVSAQVPTSQFKTTSSMLDVSQGLSVKEPVGFWEKEAHFMELGRRHRKSGAPLEHLDEMAARTKDRMTLLKGYFLEWAREDPLSALKHLKSRPGTKEVVELKAWVLREWAASGHAASALEWVQGNVSPQEQYFMSSNLVSAWMEKDPQSAMKTLSAMQEKPGMKSLLGQVVKEWGRDDPAALSRWLASQVENPAAEAVRPQAIAGIGHSDPSTAWKMLDDVVRRKTSQGVGQARIEETLTKLGGQAADYAESAATIFQEWAVTDAAEAARQASQVQAGNLRHAAMQGLAAGWSARDPYEAVKWFSSAAPRDRTAAEALVTAAAPLIHEPVREVVKRVQSAVQGDRAAQDRVLAAMAQAAAQNNQPDTAREAAAMISDPKTAAATAEMILSTP